MKMKKTMFLGLLSASLLMSGCGLYNKYQRPDVNTKGLIRDNVSLTDTLVAVDTTSFGNLPWRSVFTDPQLQNLIETALDNNADLLNAALNVKMIEAQHGNPFVTEDYSLFPKAPFKSGIYADRDGYLSIRDCAGIGECIKLLGGGRMTKEQEIDLSVGLELKVKNGDRVSKGDCLCEIMSRNEAGAEEARGRFLSSIEITDDKLPENNLVYTLND